MTFDINKFKEFMDIFHPYLRWIMLAIYGLMFLYVNRIFIKDPILRKWIMASFEERDGKASGKSITAFVFAKLIAFATLTAIIYAPNHLLPEYFLTGLLIFIGGLYGVKVASKYYDNKATGSTTSTTSVNQELPKEEEVKEEVKQEVKKDNQPNPEDIG
jgi:hypothetical protein